MMLPSMIAEEFDLALASSVSLVGRNNLHWKARAMESLVNPALANQMLRNLEAFAATRARQTKGQQVNHQHINNQQIALRQPIQESASAETVPWEVSNARRMSLIRKNLSHQISESEMQELDELQRAADERIQQLAPLPIRELEDFKSKLQQRGIVIPD